MSSSKPTTKALRRPQGPSTMACGHIIPTRIRINPFEELPLIISFSFYAFVGWQSEQDHYDAMKKDSYTEFRETFKDTINVDKGGVNIYHAALTKVYGDW